MTYETLQKKLAGVNDLPTLPIVANTVVQITQNPNTSALDVGRAISQDQALATKVLRIANSAYYGFPRKITTITHAIVILGFAHIRNIVLTASIFDVFQSMKGSTGFDQKGLWEHSLACAVTSKLIAKNVGVTNLEEIFICGMLHDFGKLILDSYLKEDFTRVVTLAQEKNMLLRDAEQEILNLDHAIVGAFVADRWNLAPSLIKAIRYHHTPPDADDSMRIAAIVHIADAICRAMGLGNGGDDKIPCIGKE